MRNIEEIYQELLASFSERAGFAPEEGCDLAVRLWAAAAQIQGLEYQADWVLDQSFPQTARGIYLDRHGMMRGMLIVDANDSDKVRQMLDDSIDFMCERHEANIAFFTRGSAVAPAFGMIGTLVGLINMLKSMDPTDSSAAAGLGASMSVALVTTLYGSFLSNVIFTPIGSLCKANHEQELLCMQIVEEGALAIVSGANPRYVQEKLEMMLSRAELQKKGKGGKAPKAEEAKQGG